MEDLLAEEDFKDSKNLEELKISIKKIEEHVERARKVVHNMLGFARRMEPRLEDVDVNETLKQTISILDNFARINNIEIRTDLAKDLPIIASDQRQPSFREPDLRHRRHGKDGLVAVRSGRLRQELRVTIAITGDSRGPSEKGVRSLLHNQGKR
jgi:two-component system NtrC family sensor kinase